MSEELRSGDERPDVAVSEELRSGDERPDVAVSQVRAAATGADVPNLASQDSRNSVPVRGRLQFTAFLALVIASGLVAAVVVVASHPVSDLWHLQTAGWVVAALVLLGELRPLVMPAGWDVNGLPTSTTFVMALLIGSGPAPVVVLVAVSVLVADLGKGKAWWRTAFNIGQYELSYVAAWLVLHAFGAAGTPSSPLHITGSQLPALLAAALVFVAINDGVVSEAIALGAGRPFLQTLRLDLRYQVSTSLALLGAAPIVVVVMQRSAWFVPLLLFPLAAVYVTTALAHDRDRRSLHDALTGLPNRTLFRTRTQEAIELAARDQSAAALLLLDLDRFKEVNDTLGHHIGDQLLIQVADRLRALVRPDDTVARLGGDEFAVVLAGSEDAAAATDIARRIGDALREPYPYDGMLLALDASIGVAMYPQHAGDVETLVQRADVAMYLAKAARSGVQVYTAEEDHNSAAKLALLGDFRRALEQRELTLHFQPKADGGTAQVKGVEALARWTHPTLGPIPPDEFVPLAEQNGLMAVLTQFVLDTALGQLAEWRLAGLSLDVAVNISATDLTDKNFVEHVRRCLVTHAVPGRSLLLEVTERVLANDDARAVQALHELTALGVRVSLDDFGTGYSSLGRLEALPVSEIKVDRSFVSRLDVQDDAPIVRSVIELAHALGVVVVAEGVETARAWRALTGYGCDQVQGYFLGRPMPAAEMTVWLQRHEGRPVLRLLDDVVDGELALDAG